MGWQLIRIPRALKVSVAWLCGESAPLRLVRSPRVTTGLGMTLLEALWLTDGRKKPSGADVTVLLNFIQDHHEIFDADRVHAALLGLARLSSSAVGFGNGRAGKRSLNAPPAPHSPEPERLWNKAEMAEFLKVSVRTVDTMMERRILPYFKLGKIVRFRQEDVLIQLQERKLRGR